MRYTRYLLLLLLTLSLGIACSERRETESETLPPATAEQVLGYWQLREVNNGVVYRAHFDTADRLYQYFEDQTGYARKRYGSWQLSGDTLYISERQGSYALLISELTDSVMLLIKPDSMTMVFDRISETDLPGHNNP